MRTRRRSMMGGFLLAMSLPWAMSHTAEPEKTHHTILVVGDSLSAEYGIRRDSGWVALLQQRLRDTGRKNWKIDNASISGDTTSGGLSRLPAALERSRPDLVILELGANDGLRGLSLSMTRDNIEKMIELARGTGAKVLLTGMQIPSNYGRAYAEQFRQMFQDIAADNEVALVPFLLQGMATDRSMFQDDGIHPNEKAQPILAENVWVALEPMLP